MHLILEFFQFLPETRKRFIHALPVPDPYAGDGKTQDGKAHGDPVIVVCFYHGAAGDATVNHQSVFPFLGPDSDPVEFR